MTEQQFECWKAQQMEMSHWMSKIVDYLDRIETQLIEIKERNSDALPEGDGE